MYQPNDHSLVNVSKLERPIKNRICPFNKLNLDHNILPKQPETTPPTIWSTLPWDRANSGRDEITAEHRRTCLAEDARNASQSNLGFVTAVLRKISLYCPVLK